jgi:hypothetical protein
MAGGGGGLERWTVYMYVCMYMCGGVHTCKCSSSCQRALSVDKAIGDYSYTRETGEKTNNCIHRLIHSTQHASSLQGFEIFKDFLRCFEAFWSSWTIVNLKARDFSSFFGVVIYCFLYTARDIWRFFEIFWDFLSFVLFCPFFFAITLAHVPAFTCTGMRWPFFPLSNPLPLCWSIYLTQRHMTDIHQHIKWFLCISCHIQDMQIHTWACETK